MTTAISATLDPCSQFQVLSAAFGSLVNSATESSDTAFRTVQVKKKDADGNIKFYEKKEVVTDPQTGAQTTTTRRFDTLTYIEHVHSGDLYKDEPWYLVSIKCACLAFALPFYGLGKIAWHVIKIPLQIIDIASESFAKIAERFKEGLCMEGINEIGHFFYQEISIFAADVFEIAKVPIFTIGCEIAAIYGIIKPYHGRRFEAMMEHAWQNGISYKKDQRTGPSQNEEGCFPCVRENNPCYMARCFQSRGNTHDPRIILVR
jgi:hypothetical protein